MVNAFWGGNGQVVAIPTNFRGQFRIDKTAVTNTKLMPMKVTM